MQSIKLYVKTSGPVWGLILRLNDKEFQLKGSVPSTPHAGAIQAVIEGLERIATPEETKVIICSDIEYLINCGGEYKYNWEQNNWKKPDGLPPANLELWKEVTALETQFLGVEWKWCHPPKDYPDDYEDSEEWVDEELLTRAGWIATHWIENEERYPEFIYLEEDADAFNTN